MASGSLLCPTIPVDPNWVPVPSCQVSVLFPAHPFSSPAFPWEPAWSGYGQHAVVSGMKEARLAREVRALVLAGLRSPRASSLSCVTRGQSLPSLIVSFLTCQMPFLAYIVPILQDFLGGSDSKESAYHVGELGSIPGPGRSSGEGKWQLTPLLLPGKSRGWRSLVCYMGSQRVGLD